MQIKIKKLRPSAKLPTKGSEAAAGWDFYADLGIGESTTLYAGERKLISLGCIMAIEHGYYLQLKPRSGLANKFGIIVLGGVIDSDYRGEVFALLYNSGSAKMEIAHLDRIIQGVVLPVPDVEIEEVSILPDTLRGEGGFGSTGK